MPYSPAWIFILKARLLKKKEENLNGCWLWKGAIGGDGYGHIKAAGVVVSVHKLSLELFKPNEFKWYLSVLHKNECGNKTCFNPDHLYAGSQTQNNLDLVETGAHNQASKTTCPKGHEYDEQNTYITSEGKRQCRKCKIARQNLSRMSLNTN